MKPILNPRPDKQGRHTLVLQIIHNRRRGVIFTPYHLLPEEFDAQRCLAVAPNRTKAARLRAREINDYIETQLRELQRTVHTLELSGKSYTPRDITSAYRRRSDLRCVRTFVEQQCAELERQRKHGTSVSYRSMLSVFEKFTGDKNCRFDRLDERFLAEFENFMKGIPLTRNTITFHLRILRALYNKARRKGLAPNREESPFGEVSFRIDKTRKLAVGTATLRRVAEADFSQSPWLAETRDLFMFSFYARGMSFVDMAYLTRDNLRDGMIHYTRHKTRQVFTVRIVEPLQTIIDRYAHCAPWVLPVMKNSTLKAQTTGMIPDLQPDMPTERLYRHYKSALTDYWYHLGTISKLLDTEKRLTFNVARHSWASLAQDRGIPLAVISGGLGHTSEKTTSIYLDEIDARKVDEANELLSKL